MKNNKVHIIIVSFALLIGYTLLGNPIDFKSVSLDRVSIDTTLPVQILKVELVTQLDSQVSGGGFDSSTDFDRRLVSKVSDCIDNVANICRKWAQDKELVILKSEIQKYSNPKRVYFQLYVRELSGIFEIIYTVNSEAGRAQISFWFYDKSGTKRNPDLGKYEGMSNLLFDAMQCIR